MASTTARGYGGTHQREKRRWVPIVAAGEAFCMEVICLMPSRWIRPGTPWHLAHTPDRSGYRGPAHQRCNIAERNRRHARQGKRRITKPPPRW